MSRKEEPLTEALRRLAAAQQSDDKQEPPTPKTLMDYHRGRLDEGAQAEVEAYLALHPEAAQEYLDLIEPSRLEGPSQEHEYSDRQVAQAFESLQDQIGDMDDSPIGQHSRSESFRPIAKPEVEPPPVSRSRWWAIAALLGFITLGVWWLLGQTSTTPPDSRFASVLDIQPTRGDRSLNVSPESDTLLLLFHDIELAPEEEATLEITSTERGVTLERRIQAGPAADNLLYLLLAKEDLPYGRYRVTIYTGRGEARQVVQEYSLQLTKVP